MKTKFNRNEKSRMVSEGIWTPWAHILCYECHGDTFKNTKYNPNTEKFEDTVLSKEEFEECKKPIPLKDGNGVTVCTSCGKDIQVRWDLAKEGNLNSKLKSLDIESCMAQTGGMCSAVEIARKDGGYILATVSEENDEYWYLGMYDKDGEYDYDSSLDVSDNEVVDKILELLKK